MTYQVVEQCGYADERLIAECETFSAAKLEVLERYTQDEIDELHVRILKDWSTEY